MPAVSTPVRRAGVLSLLLAVALLMVPMAAEPAAARAAGSSSERLMRRLINDERVERGRDRLWMNERLVWLARKHSQKMANEGRIWHSRNLPEALPWKNAWWGENVGMGHSVESLHSLFMASDGHRWNLLYPHYQRVGVGVVHEDGRTFVTVIFVGF